MSLFLLTFFLLYGGVHVYAYLKARQAFILTTLPSLLLALFMVLMVLAPVLVRLAERRGMEETGRVLAYTGYLWMGFLFLFFSASVAVDLYHGALWTAGKFSGREFIVLHLSPKMTFLLPFAWGCFISVYGAFEARHITVEQITIKTPKLSPATGKVRIVQVSDVHLGLIVRGARLSRIIERVREADPDVLVSTGDLVDGQLDGLTGLASMFNHIRPRYGKFAVTGNHEFYAGLKPSLVLTEQAGFKVLRGERVPVTETITVAGVDDPAVHRSGPDLRGAEQALLRGVPPDRFTLLLKHRPKVEESSLGLFDLQLSGHVHKGQIFPFNLLTHIFYPIQMGLSKFPGHSALYVSRGTGTWGPPIRFLSPPEVTVIDLLPSDRQ